LRLTVSETVSCFQWQVLLCAPASKTLTFLQLRSPTLSPSPLLSLLVHIFWSLVTGACFGRLVSVHGFVANMFWSVPHHRSSAGGHQSESVKSRIRQGCGSVGKSEGIGVSESWHGDR
jgi:hypothetical protein